MDKSKQAIDEFSKEILNNECIEMSEEDVIPKVISEIDETIINICKGINENIKSDGLDPNITENTSALAELISARAQLENILPKYKRTYKKLDNGHCIISSVPIMRNS